MIRRRWTPAHATPTLAVRGDAMDSHDWSDSSRMPAGGFGMAALLIAVGLLLLGAGWIAIHVFLSILTNLTQLS